MNILYLGDAGSWHNALWVQHFCESEEHNVYLFSDKNYQGNKVKFPKGCTIIESGGLLGKMLHLLKQDSPKMRHINKVLSLYYFRYLVNRLIKQLKIDIVHCHSLYYGYIGTGVPTNIPVVFTPLGTSIIVHAQKPGYYKKMAKAAFSRADIVTNDSKILQRAGYAVGAKKEGNFIIQFGVDQKLCKPYQSSIREEYGVPQDTLLLFSPRAIDPLYNIDTILDSLALLKNANIKFKCMFTYAFGNDNFAILKEQAERLGVQEHLIWLGFRPYEKMPDVYNAADIAISVPSSDSSPKSVYEAMSCKVPTILSILPWSSEILQEGRDFIGVEVRNSRALADAIQMLANDKERASQIAENGYKQAKANFSYDLNIRKMEQVMLQAISDKS